MNTVGYFEIHAENLNKAREFYSNVFDWKFVKDDTLPIEYWRIEMAGINGGVLQRPANVSSLPQRAINAFVCSIQVAHFDRTAEKILKNGGQVAMAKFSVVGKCWQGYFLDSQGNTFGLFEVDKNASL